MTPASFGRIVRLLAHEALQSGEGKNGSELIKAALVGVLSVTDPNDAIERVAVSVKMKARIGEIEVAIDGEARKSALRGR